MTRPLSFGFLPLALILFACGQSPQQRVASPVADGRIDESLAGAIQGQYIGQYSKGILRLTINYVSGNTVSGYDVHKGLRRNVNGQVQWKDNFLQFVLKEPGGNPYDGTFYLKLDPTRGKMTGNWIPTDSTKAHAGELHLERYTGKGGYEVEESWVGELGDLSFQPDGTVTLEYHPTEDENAQLITVHGSYEHQGDTFRIEWQRNSRTPVLKMKLISLPARPENDTTEYPGPHLKGSGVDFHKNMAG